MDTHKETSTFTTRQGEKKQVRKKLKTNQPDKQIKNKTKKPRTEKSHNSNYNS